MSVLRFTGANSRDAMRQVRAALGEDALILANRRTEAGVEVLAMAEPSVTQAPMPAAPGAGQDEAFQAMSARLLQEMQEMRSLLAAQRPETAADTPRQRLSGWLAESGFSRPVADEVLAGLPESLADGDEESWLVSRLAGRLPVQEDELALLDRGGILALVGPTGVGKTTTAAKLAARFVMRHGPDQVALVSTDGFRIGAHEQLRIYAELLGIPMHGLDLDEPLEALLPALADRRFVIIDTVGMSQRDQRVIDQVARLQGGAAVRPVLLLNAASQPEALEEVITNYRKAARAAGLALDDCVISKQDEAGSLGPLLDALMRHGLRLLFVAHGQRVPEDLAVVEAETLARQALAVRRAAGRQALPAAGVTTLLGQGRRLAVLLAALRDRIPGFRDLEAAWALAGVPPSLQAMRLDALLARAEPPRGSRVWMPRARVRGEEWSQPDLCLDPAGQWSALPRPQHLVPAGERERLAEAEAAGPLGAHLLAGLPGEAARGWLAERRRDWVAQVRGSLRVEAGGERHSLAYLEAAMTPRQPRGVRWRGREAELRLAACPVTLGSEPAPLRAWRGELVDLDSGRSLKRCYWLAPEALRGRAVPLLLAQLAADALPALTRRANRRLAEVDPAMAPALRLTLAAGLAAVAVQLEASGEAWAISLRAELLGLLGGRRRGNAETLLEALLHLGLAREALRELGSVGLEGLH